MGKTRRDIDIVEKLRKEGPKYVDPDAITVKMRRDNISKFNPSSSNKGSSMSGGGTMKPVYYIRHDHSPKQIINSWMEMNKEGLKSITKWALHQRISSYGEKFKQASKEVNGPFESLEERGGDYDTGGECPLCGDEYKSSLAYHLPCNQE